MTTPAPIALSPRTYTWCNEGGFKAKSYQDSRGYWTVGVGCRGTDPYCSPTPIIGPRTLWTPQQGQDEFIKRHDLATVGAANDLGPTAWACLDLIRRAALMDCAFQMGAGNCHGDDDPATGDGGLAGFHEALSAVAARSWQAAHDALLDSQYARQTPPRAQRNAMMLLSGEWPSAPF